ncbi:class I tRNA ligase family protein [Candidatus Woesearchaeota archaeon]|nr:class I tRNA ligase family protein [Candidatus Woesearchaeota archaeon]
MGIMANPEIDYVRAETDGEIWIVAKDLAGVFFNGVAERKYCIIEEFKGDKLEGMEYEHPFHDMLKTHYDGLREKHPKVHTIVLSTEYVHTDSGTGLVHMASGCGPEDYEVGHRNGIPPWNTLTESGHYPEGMGELSGLHSYNDNPKFTEILKELGAVVGENEVEHEYPHAQRSKKPVIFRATEQWFFKVEDMVGQMLKENKGIYWVPEAAFNAFDSWLANLRDNSITKQRYWGTPLPIWVCDKTGKHEVIGSIKELREKAGRIPDDLHKPWIDDVTYKSPFHPEGTMKRIPDVLDVWVDAGSASWNCLDYPQRREAFDKLFPADFILEGKDQIRGWFNLLHVASMIAFGKPSFRACYMHGFINDSQGRKMSKSLGNYILPAEIVMDYGADTLRYYMIGGTSPGVDINYNFEDMKVKHKNIGVLWNLHKYVIDMASNLGVNPAELKFSSNDLGTEEKYIFSRLHSTINAVTELYEKYRLNEVPKHIESLFLDLSRTYIQLTREKSGRGSDEEKRMVLFTVYNVLLESIRMFATIAPFISEKIYLNFRDKFAFKNESISHYGWPEADSSMINPELEKGMEAASEIVQAGLALRERLQLGVRWPLKEVLVVSNNQEVLKSAQGLKEIIMVQVNAKEANFRDKMQGVRQKAKADYSKLGPVFGELVPKIIAHLTINSPETILEGIEKNGKYECSIDGRKVAILREHLSISREVPPPYEEMAFSKGYVYLNREITDELEAEGFAREVMRRIQALRKKAGLQKRDEISLFLKVDEELDGMLRGWKIAMKDKVGAKLMKISQLYPGKEHKWQSKEKVKDKEFEIHFDVF